MPVDCRGWTIRRMLLYVPTTWQQVDERWLIDVHAFLYHNVLYVTSCMLHFRMDCVRKLRVVVLRFYYSAS